MAKVQPTNCKPLLAVANQLSRHLSFTTKTPILGRKRLELAERDNQQLKASLYDLSARMNAITAGAGRATRPFDVDDLAGGGLTPHSQVLIPLYDVCPLHPAPLIHTLSQPIPSPRLRCPSHPFPTHPHPIPSHPVPQTQVPVPSIPTYSIPSQATPLCALVVLPALLPTYLPFTVCSRAAGVG